MWWWSPTPSWRPSPVPRPSPGGWNGGGATYTASDAVRQMGVGINLGQTYDAHSSGQSKSTQRSRQLIDLFQSGGFKHVRIPVTWGNSFRRHGSGFVSNVTDSVDHALRKGLWVMINTHHEHWLKDHYDGSKRFDDMFYKLWVDIATHFKSKSYKLVYEVLNEPESKFGCWAKGTNPNDGRAKDWTRRINKVGYDAIRSVDPKRVVFVSPNAQGNSHQLAAVYGNKGMLPGGGGDPHVAVTVHTYDPWNCNGQTGTNAQCGSEQEVRNRVGGYVGMVSGWSGSNGVPVHWGEYGLGRQNNPSERNTNLCRGYYEEATRKMVQAGHSPCVWDDQGWFAVTQGNRWVYGIKDAIMRGAR
eukprot:TRINITY_DN2314_c0_g2_i7.p2 TRINITY_DN2314_c0_g2~~TRINITY_DN2314_c0_g2_i7.p2  ORF type:complete len:357 (-),score=50.02 TRINITY_DN2314_c0_g2_i7:99-1169(-)